MNTSTPAVSIDGVVNLAIAVLNVVAWTAIFVGGAAWRMSKDTMRV